MAGIKLAIHTQYHEGPQLEGLAVIRTIKTLLREALPKVCQTLGVKRGSWEIALVDDPTMIQLHQRSLGLATPTDVLTFNMADGEPDASDTGTLELETIIGLDEAWRQGLEENHPLEHEVLLYAIHSLLHVCGYDDQEPAAHREMHQKEDELLTQLGIGPVYQPRKHS